MSDNTSHYTVLARRFRPQTFEDVVGQQHVAQSLRNAIHSGRVAHAYLFTGARGVGKTSMARILAKVLNCPEVQDGVPCNTCEICTGISAGNDVDVLEIDGASNRGIDDIRSLRANVNVKSMRTKFKIYIIDEVHMLTREAFNALLKTLEEPPPNVKFVFCTTEPNKLPDTILSRCQRFDFSTIETTNIIGRLEQIAEAEGFEVEPAALELVARRAAGSMRDSQSLFDQLLAFGGENVSAEDVHRLFGTANDDRLIELIDALLTRRRDVVIQLFDQTLSEGVQLGELVDQLLHCFRDLMVLASGANGVGLMGVSEENRAPLTRQANEWGLQTIVAAMEILAEARNRMFRASYGRTIAETALIRISLLDELDRLSELIQALKQGTVTTPPTGAPRNPRPQASPPAPQSRPSTTSAPNSGQTPEKKTPEPDDNAEKIAEAVQEAEISVEFAPGNEQELWSQVIAKANDASKTHFRNCTVAISGPNQLDTIFPASYHFSKQFCERPEIVGPLEKLVSSIAGRSIRIHMKLQEVSAEEQNAKQQEKSPAENSSESESNQNVSATEMKQKISESENDPFVTQAVDVFGGEVLKVENIRTPAPSQE